MNRQGEGLKFARIYRIERIGRSRVVEDEKAWPARSTLDYESGQTARRPIRDSAHACRMKLCISHFFPLSVDNATVALVPGCHLWKSHAIIRRQIWAAAVYSKFGLFLFLAPTFRLGRPWSRSPLFKFLSSLVVTLCRLYSILRSCSLATHSRAVSHGDPRLIRTAWCLHWMASSPWIREVYANWPRTRKQRQLLINDVFRISR